MAKGQRSHRSGHTGIVIIVIVLAQEEEEEEEEMSNCVKMSSKPDKLS